ncbi:MAG: 50S ribosomal protein L11 methyltransferase [Clostridia bacterium]|nr:50S ribosomal protein L11 methyltransferase [Clostridia bacterium]
MKYIEITITTSHIGSELVADLMSEFFEDGISISDIEDVISLEKNGKNWDYADDSIYSADKTVLVKGYLEPKKKAVIKDIEASLLRLKENSPFDLGSLEVIKRKVDGNLWKKIWKKHFKPLHIDNIVICPEWIKYSGKANEKIVKLGSNMAFGTGEHETTSMCVEFLNQLVKEGDTVLDVGCGSGILGITACKLGAKKVIMTDIDECAVKATEKNMKLNEIKNGEVYLKNLLDDSSVKGNVIVANIIASVLINFSKDIGNNLLDNGLIILSGILVEYLDSVKKAYLDAGFKFIEQKIKGEWSALVFQKVTK